VPRVTDDELIDYVLGVLPASRAKAIAHAASTDPELAATLELASDVAGAGRTAPPPAGQIVPHIPPTEPMYFSRRQAFALGGTVLGVGALIWGGREILRDRPLMEDNFDDDWLDQRIWSIKRTRPEVREIDGQLRLTNRGSVTTQSQFEEPITVTFDWMWIDLKGDPHYSDTLTVALRSSGTHDSSRPFEVVDGCRISLSTTGAKVEIFRGAEVNPSSRTQIGAVPIPPSEWHRVRITDDGHWIRVYLKGPKIDRGYWERPVLEAECPDLFTERRITIYNRERTSDVDHESRIDNFKVSRLQR